MTGSLLLPLLLAANPAKSDAVRNVIDDALAKHWQNAGVEPAARCDDATFLRRTTLDLAGRIPTVAETKAFLADQTAEKRAKLIGQLLHGPEYPLHIGRVLDEILQDKYSGDGEFLDYLRAAVAKRKPWDQVFRDVMLGPWDDKERKGAAQFLLKRIKNADEMATDTSRVFFGVNVSCAQCHDHPHVQDWKQDHYFGMVSFFNRTAGKGGGKGGQPGGIEEKNTGEVMFNTTKGARKTAKMMFLSSQVIDEEKLRKDTKTPYSRREQLVKVALDEKGFFSRAIVNQLWANLLGRGLVSPVDQMHSANAPAIPGLLEALADDLAKNGYDIHRLVEGIVSSRVYQLESVKARAAKATSDKDFATASLRSLTPHQLGASLLLATGDFELADPDKREAQWKELENRASRLVKTKLFDPRTDRYQTSTGEALYLSNHPEVQKLVEPTKSNLVGRLAAINDTRQIVDTAIWQVLGRACEEDERDYLVKWLESKPERAKGCRQLVWALMTSAEFRFQH